MRLRSTSALLAAVLAFAVLAGCAGAVVQPKASTTPATDRASVFIAVLTRYLANGSENSFGDNSRWPAVYVLSSTDPGAADSTHPEGTGGPISAAEQQTITAAMADANVSFVPDRASVLEQRDTCTRVRGHGILITLGPPVPAGEDLHVGIYGFVACLGATWLTYVVSPAGGWHVSGRTGPMMVS